MRARRGRMLTSGAQVHPQPLAAPISPAPGCCKLYQVGKRQPSVVRGACIHAPSTLPLGTFPDTRAHARIRMRPPIGRTRRCEHASSTRVRGRRAGRCRLAAFWSEDGAPLRWGRSGKRMCVGGLSRAGPFARRTVGRSVQPHNFWGTANTIPTVSWLPNKFLARYLVSLLRRGSPGYEHQCNPPVHAGPRRECWSLAQLRPGP